MASLAVYTYRLQDEFCFILFPLDMQLESILDPGTKNGEMTPETLSKLSVFDTTSHSTDVLCFHCTLLYCSSYLCSQICISPILCLAQTLD
uniref:Uncharacterized protein n=1 Tax=Serinus canaria TaxID=9135 RepID=A0A8C9MI45_SERCA